jgi:hypothetical protein
MASYIRIKRSTTQGNPSHLVAGELAYSAADYGTVSGGGRLYIGIGTETGTPPDAASHIVIGGQYFTDKLDHTPGTLTASSAIITDAQNKIDIFNVDNLQLDGSSLKSTDLNGNIFIDPNGSGYVQIIGSNALILPVGNIANRSPSIAGGIRFNSELNAFEGYDGTNWASLGGVRSVDGRTYISAELTPGASDDILRFYVDNVLQMTLDTNSLDIASTVTTVNIDATTASTNYTNGALVVDGGVGIAGNLNVQGAITGASVGFSSINNTPIGNVTPSTGAFTILDVDNIRIDGNTIESTNNNGNISILPNGSGKLILKNTYIGDEFTSLLEYIQDASGGTLVAGEGIDITYDDGAGTSTIAAELAESANKGVASFDINDFVVTLGHVELVDTVIKSITTDSGAGLVPSTHTIEVRGGEGIDVTHAGNVITVAGELATTANIGVASFNSASFDVTNGDVTIKTAGVSNTQLANSSITIGTTNVALGGTSTSLGGVTQLDVDNIRINGNEILSTDTNGNIVLNPNGTGVVDLSSARITNLAEPVNPQDAATKNYVDTLAEGLHIHEACHVATPSSLEVLTGGTVSYNNGTDGVGAFITLSVAITTIDNHTLSNGDRILVKNQTPAARNGIYTWATGGTVLTRATDFDTGIEIAGGDFVFVESGTLYNNTGWVQTEEVVTVGTDSLLWQQFAGAGTYTAGSGLALVGNQFSLNISLTGGLGVVADQLQLLSTTAGNGLTLTSGVYNVGGTADRITVGADAVDIASTYVGQTSITTLGTITTGVWNGTAIGPAYGGLGISSISANQLLVGAAGNTYTTLSMGTAGQVLQVNSAGTALVYGDIDGGTY